MGHLGGLLFDGRHSCTEDSFIGHSGLYCGDCLAVSILVCETRSMGFKWERVSLSNGMFILVMEWYA